MRPLLVLILFLFRIAVAVAAPAQEPWEERLRQLEARIEELEKRLQAQSSSADTATRETLAELRRQIESLTREIETLRSGVPEKTSAAGSQGVLGFGPAASRVYRTERGVSIGGYGEALYQNFDGKREDGAPSGRSDEIDLARAVFYFGYKFNDRILFNSEIEYEHGTTGSGSEAKGEVSMEFAYIDFFARKGVGIRAGLVLVPMGLVNELHEPPVYLGARRPETETRILPSTWRELGVGFFGDLGPFAYRLYLVNGLDANGFSASTGIRGGRQKGSRALAEDFALTGRLDFVGVPGLTVGASAFSGDSAHGRRAGAQNFDARVTLFDVHGAWRWRALQVRALGAWGRIGEADRVNALRGLTGNASVGERFFGIYAEAGYDLLFARGKEAALVAFARYERFDTQAQVPAGFSKNPANDVRLWTLGIQSLPIPQVVVKADYQIFKNRSRTGTNQFNLALGYLF